MRLANLKSSLERHTRTPCACLAPNAGVNCTTSCSLTIRKPLLRLPDSGSEGPTVRWRYESICSTAWVVALLNYFHQNGVNIQTQPLSIREMPFRDKHTFKVTMCKTVTNPESSTFNTTPLLGLSNRLVASMYDTTTPLATPHVLSTLHLNKHHRGYLSFPDPHSHAARFNAVTGDRVARRLWHHRG